MKSVVRPGTCTKTAACNTNKGEPKCLSCSLWVKEIKKSCRGKIIWKNTDPSRWHELAWEIAKCYMNAQGSKETARAVTGPENTDLSGILNVLVNCKEIRDNRLKEKKLAEEVRNVRNKLMHCADMSLSEEEMRDMVDKVIALLEDEKELKKLQVCQNTVEFIKSLKNCKFELKQVDEEQCFEEVLKSYKLAVELKENGEDIELDSFKVFKEVFKEYNDLQRFSEKVSDVEKDVKRMKQEYDAKFSAIDFEYGELKGKVQYIYEKFPTLNIENLQQQTLYVNGINIRPSYTAVLHNIAQKKKKEPPKYTENSDGKKFTANVLFDGKTFSCKEPKSSKKEAKESAAEVAVNFLGQQDIQPDITPQTRKVDARQMAAEFVLRFLESEEKKVCVNGTDSTDGNLSESSCHYLQMHENEDSNQSTPADDCDQPCTSIEVKPGDNLQKEKNYRSQLNEYLQKKNEKSPAKYEDEKLDSGQFQSHVTVLGKTFTGEGSSKKKSQEMAAMEAYKYCNLKSTEIDNDTDSSTAIVPCVDESLIDTSYQNAVGQSPSDTSTLATREELEVAENTTTNSTTTGTKAIVHLPEDFKTDLKEFAEKRNLKVQYDIIKSKDKTTECFLSKVFVGRRCFIGKRQKSKIKEAKKHVAEIALSIMKEKKHDMDYSRKDTLDKYNKGFGFSDYPEYETQQLDNEEFIVEIKVKKKFEIKCNESKPSKKDLKKCLVEMAIQRLENEKKTIPNGDNASSRFNKFIQSEKGETKQEFCIEEKQPPFTGLLRFYIVEIYESLISCSTEEEAVISAAMSASNALDLL
ncbi:uncharacterized protein LOC124447028 [Xenia sp. Carnegie-2017]|uniref:uncharacterized protein LOC124447028 n=1 Tax=Xenia sp. Carnegie-2017 TaxID=2897299 RepID=UPI001F049845|nr:uncharacterized protein LOC124447028 [Xenia sp. Carnegie-2017]XP_046853884.1 uncharacterized protein LOC124447028 [Xenia sp. Carnegie-2017]XP_046853885.1 uncharacterized protein LOC124447028 [Xenia sp. Carnegie-2017]